MTDHKPYSEMTDEELASDKKEWLRYLARARGPSSARFASTQCDLIEAEIARRKKAEVETPTHRYDPTSFEAGERSMRERAAKVALDFGEVFRVRHRSSYAEGYTDASDTIAQAICALSSTG